VGSAPESGLRLAEPIRRLPWTQLPHRVRRRSFLIFGVVLPYSPSQPAMWTPALWSLCEAGWVSLPSPFTGRSPTSSSATSGSLTTVLPQGFTSHCGRHRESDSNISVMCVPLPRFDGLLTKGETNPGPRNYRFPVCRGSTCPGSKKSPLCRLWDPYRFLSPG